MNPESFSDARKVIRYATSSQVPNLDSGVAFLASSNIASGYLWVPVDSMTPGATEFSFILYLDHSTARDFVRLSTPALRK